MLKGKNRNIIQHHSQGHIHTRPPPPKLVFMVKKGHLNAEKLPNLNRRSRPFLWSKRQLHLALALVEPLEVQISAVMTSAFLVGRMLVPKDVYVLMPKAYEYAALHRKRDFVDGIKTPRMG